MQISSATEKLPLFSSATGNFRYFLDRIAELTEIKKVIGDTNIRKELTSREYVLVIHLICFAFLHRGRPEIKKRMTVM